SNPWPTPPRRPPRPGTDSTFPPSRRSPPGIRCAAIAPPAAAPLPKEPARWENAPPGDASWGTGSCRPRRALAAPPGDRVANTLVQRQLRPPVHLLAQPVHIRHQQRRLIGGGAASTKPHQIGPPDLERDAINQV